jgi:hypothetical protein
MAYSILDTNDFHVTLDTVMDQHWVGNTSDFPTSHHAIRPRVAVHLGGVGERRVPVMRDLATALARHRRHA